MNVSELSENGSKSAALNRLRCFENLLLLFLFCFFKLKALLHASSHQNKSPWWSFWAGDCTIVRMEMWMCGKLISRCPIRLLIKIAALQSWQGFLQKSSAGHKFDFSLRSSLQFILHYIYNKHLDRRVITASCSFSHHYLRCYNFMISWSNFLTHKAPVIMLFIHVSTCRTTKKTAHRSPSYEAFRVTSNLQTEVITVCMFTPHVRITRWFYL